MCRAPGGVRERGGPALLSNGGPSARCGRDARAPRGGSRKAGLDGFEEWRFEQYRVRHGAGADRQIPSIGMNPGSARTRSIHARTDG